MINSYLVRKLKGILLQGRLHEEVILAMEGKSQTSGYGGIGRHARFRFWFFQEWEFESLHRYYARIAQFG